MNMHWLRLSAAGLLLAGAGAVFAADYPPDNTGKNVRDRAPGAITADNQSENKADRSLTQKIRKAVVDDGSLSVNAHNVKIVSNDGNVTLRGPVNSEDEKTRVAKVAKKVAGVRRV